MTCKAKLLWLAALFAIYKLHSLFPSDGDWAINWLLLSAAFVILATKLENQNV